MRPRYRRITAAGAAALVTLVAVLGGVDILPTQSSSEAAYASAPERAAGGGVSDSLPRQPDPGRTGGEPVGAEIVSSVSTALPEDSGRGKRVVFDISDQRVWLVTARDEVARTYLVSGSVTDNLAAGSYEVYSRSLRAVGIDDSGTMRYMVRFAHGKRAAIGFHDIPVLRGEKVQTAAELGTPQSHGCIRQLRSDARALWDFAPVGTPVVVLD
jgi:lipoprotein-anchoring transpeptidase ErfK/SrfK